MKNKISTVNDPQIQQVCEVISQLAAGNLEARGSVTADGGNFDEIIEGLNMLAEAHLTLATTLTATKNHLDNIIKLMLDSLIVINSDAIIQTVNQSTLNLLGYEEHELIGNSIGIILEDDEQRVFCRTGIEKLAKQGFIQSVEKTYLSKSGKMIPVLFSGSVMEDKAGKIQGVVCVAKNITEHKQVAEELEEAYTIINRSSSVAFTWKNDENWPVEFVSENVEKLFGYTVKEFLSGKVSFASCVHPDDLERVGKEVEDFSRDPSRAEFTHEPYRIITRDNIEKIISDWTFIVRNEAGEATHFKGIVQDVTNQKQAEAQIREFQKIQSIGTLSGGIAHEFNNILQIMLGYGYLLHGKVSQNEREYVENICKAGDRGKKLVEQLLIFSRPSKVKLKPSKLEFLIKECSQLMLMTIPPTIEIHENIDFDCGNTLVEDNQIYQVFVNLFNNAVHAIEGDKGIIEINLTQIEFDADNKDIPELKKGSYLKLTIKDDGCGMPPEVKERIFEPFYTTKEVGKGTGLGLSVVHGIIKHHKGVINVESEPEKGTRFDIYFPVIEEKPLEEFTPPELFNNGKGHILYIDDEPALNKLFEDFLEGLGYTVTSTDNSTKALEIFRNNPDTFSMVITDQGMPGMSGTKLAAQILNIRPRVPIILLTGYGEIIYEQQAAEVGIHHCLRKPIDFKKLSKVMMDIIEVE